MWHPDMPEEYKNQIVTGDARILSRRIPDESVDLIFTDPVYQNIDDYRWVAETAARVLKPSGHLLVFVSQQHFLEQTFAISKFLIWGWLFGVLIAGRRTPIWQKKIQSCGQFIAWFAKSDFVHFEWVEDFAKEAFSLTYGHKWRKGIKSSLNYLRAFCGPGGIVWDPFSGSCTIPAVCKMQGRNYIAFEIDPDTAELARERVRNTQPPLFVMEPEQLELLDEDRQNGEN